jgi:hypothetical protein
MADGTQVRSASPERRAPSTRRPPSPKNGSYASPYRRFERGGIYRFRALEPVFRPFRIT